MKPSKKFNLSQSILVGLGIALVLLVITTVLANPFLIKLKFAEQKEVIAALSTAKPPVLTAEAVQPISDLVSTRYQWTYSLSNVLFKVGLIAGGAVAFFLAKEKKLLSSVCVGILYAIVITVYSLGSSINKEKMEVQYWQEHGVETQMIAQYQSTYQKNNKSLIVSLPERAVVAVLFSLAGSLVILSIEKIQKSKTKLTLGK